MPSFLDAARNWVDQIHLNDSMAAERDGRSVWLKRRRLGAGWMMRFANGFFRLARNPVEAIVSRKEWREWEVECFRLLHAPDYTAGCGPDGLPWVQMIDGKSLASFLDTHSLTPGMLAAATLELKRAHGIHCPHYGSAWSHGDPHTGNFVFCEQRQRAWLIDFEVRHLATLSVMCFHCCDPD
jgi:hypothetical protein